MAKTVDYVGPHFEVEMVGSQVTTRSHVFFGERAVFDRLASTQSGLLQEYFLHRDHLGSVDKLSWAGGSTTSTDTSYSFDAFGKRRFDDWRSDPGDDELAESQWTERGYTGHEHLDKVKLIHMNGRVQDPILGRMLSADPLLGDLTDPQSLNRYSYVRNNPLGLTDPSGFEVEPFGDGWCTAGGCQRLDLLFNPAINRGGFLAEAPGARLEKLDREAGWLEQMEPAGATGFSGGTHNFQNDLRFDFPSFRWGWVKVNDGESRPDELRVTVKKVPVWSNFGVGGALTLLRGGMWSDGWAGRSNFRSFGLAANVALSGQVDINYFTTDTWTPANGSAGLTIVSVQLGMTYVTDRLPAGRYHDKSWYREIEEGAVASLGFAASGKNNPFQMDLAFGAFRLGVGSGMFMASPAAGTIERYGIRTPQLWPLGR